MVEFSASSIERSGFNLQVLGFEKSFNGDNNLDKGSGEVEVVRFGYSQTITDVQNCCMAAHRRSKSDYRKSPKM